jgi:hypothetical protein
MGTMKSAYKILVGIPERKRSLGRRKRRWEDNIRMDARETGWEVVDWIHVTQDRGQWRIFVSYELSHWPK